MQPVLAGKAWQEGQEAACSHRGRSGSGEGNSGTQLAVSLFTFYWDDAISVRSGASVKHDYTSQIQPEVIQIQPVGNGLAVKIRHHKMAPVLFFPHHKFQRFPIKIKKWGSQGPALPGFDHL